MNQETKHRERALDTSTDRIGEVMERRGIGRGERVWLRPVGGGIEWEADGENVQPVSGHGQPT